MAFRNPVIQKTKDLAPDSKLNEPNPKKRKLEVKARAKDLPKAKPINVEEPHKKFAFYAQKSLQSVKLWNPPLKTSTSTTVKCHVKHANKENSMLYKIGETSHCEKNLLLPHNIEKEYKSDHEKLRTQPRVAQAQLHYKMNATRENLETPEFLKQNSGLNQFKREYSKREIVNTDQSKKNTTKTLVMESENKEFLKNKEEEELNKSDEIQLSQNIVSYLLERKDFQENSQKSQVICMSDQPFSLKSTYTHEKYERDEPNIMTKMTKMKEQFNSKASMMEKPNSIFQQNNIQNSAAGKTKLSLDKNYKKTANFQIQLQGEKLNFADKKPVSSLTFSQKNLNCDSIGPPNEQKILDNNETANINDNNLTRNSTSDDDLDNYISKAIDKYMDKDRHEEKVKEMLSRTQLYDSSQETVILSAEIIKRPKLLLNEEGHLQHPQGEEPNRENDKAKLGVSSNFQNNSKFDPNATTTTALESLHNESDILKKASIKIPESFKQKEIETAQNEHQFLTNSQQTNFQVFGTKYNKRGKNEIDSSQETIILSAEIIKKRKLRLNKDYLNYPDREKSKKKNGLKNLSNFKNSSEFDPNATTTTALESLQIDPPKLMENRLDIMQRYNEDSMETKTDFSQRGSLKLRESLIQKETETNENEGLTTSHVFETNDGHQKYIKTAHSNNKDENENYQEKNDYILEFQNDKENELFMNLEEKDYLETPIPQYTTTNIFQKTLCEGGHQYDEFKDGQDNISNLGKANMNQIKILNQNLELLKVKAAEKKKQEMKINSETRQHSFSNSFMKKSGEPEKKIYLKEVTNINSKLSHNSTMTKEQEYAQQTVMKSSLKSADKTENILFSELIEETSCVNTVPNRIDIDRGANLTQLSNPFFPNGSQPSHFLHQSEKPNKPEVTKKFFCTFTELYENKCLVESDLSANVDRQPPFVNSTYSEEKVVTFHLSQTIRSRSQYLLNTNQNDAQNDKSRRFDDSQQRKMDDLQELKWTWRDEKKNNSTQKIDCDIRFHGKLFSSQTDFKNKELINLHSSLKQPPLSHQIELPAKTNYQDYSSQTLLGHALENPPRISGKSSSQPNKAIFLRQNHLKVQERLYFLKEFIEQSKTEREKKTDNIRSMVSQTNTLVNNLIESIKFTAKR